MGHVRQLCMRAFPCLCMLLWAERHFWEGVRRGGFCWDYEPYKARGPQPLPPAALHFASGALAELLHSCVALVLCRNSGLPYLCSITMEMMVCWLLPALTGTIPMC